MKRPLITGSCVSLGLLFTLSLGSFSEGTVEKQHDTFAWTQWNGPQANGVSAEVEWSSVGDEDPLWEAQLGIGYSSVTVEEGKLFTMGYEVEPGLDTVFCFDAMTGEELWGHSYPSKIFNRAHEGGTVNTPSIDGDVLFALNREGNLFALEIATGEIRWHLELMAEGNLYELTVPTWGFSASPLLVGDEMILNCGRLLSVDKATGDVVWVSDSFGAGYGTPVALEYKGKAALAVQNADGLAMVDRENGETISFMQFGGTGRGVAAASPVLIDGDLYISAGSLPSCARIDLSSDKLEPVWQNTNLVANFPGCVAIDGHLFGFDRLGLGCLSADGERQWNERGLKAGAVSGAGERLLVLNDAGEFMVLSATPEGLDTLYSAKIFDDGKYWTKPVLVNGIIYCRSSKGHLVALDHRP